MLTDTIPTPGWWLLDNRNAARLAQPFTNQERLSQLLYSEVARISGDIARVLWRAGYRRKGGL